MSGIRALAFYLPQFHPIPENDEWWGPGFTEWRNVVQCQPRFKGHWQPHLPADLGFYDLRVPEVREHQAELARSAGIHGFCYYHYWFNGRRLLERPFNDVLSSGKPDFPFCLCWANENWTRAWDGQDRQLLLGQDYCEDDDRNHIRWLIEAFKDSRYIKIAGKPVFLVYRITAFPNPEKTAQLWRQEVENAGFPGLYLCKVESLDDRRDDATRHGFDASVEFQPDGRDMGRPLRRGLISRLAGKCGLIPKAFFENRVHEYATLVRRVKHRRPAGYKRFPCVSPMWDNSARRKSGARILIGSTPELYETWLRQAVSRVPDAVGDENLLFINAWNEWAEGNHLEPCLKWGKAYLEATRRVLV